MERQTGFQRSGEWVSITALKPAAIWSSSCISAVISCMAAACSCREEDISCMLPVTDSEMPATELAASRICLLVGSVAPAASITAFM